MDMQAELEAEKIAEQKNIQGKDYTEKEIKKEVQ